MTFRDDHDATLARADALERELERVKDRLELAERAAHTPVVYTPVDRLIGMIVLAIVLLVFCGVISQLG